MNARDQAALDQLDAQTTSFVRQHGWAIEYVDGGECPVPGCYCSGPDDPPFAYTVGMFGLAHPELLIFGVPPDIAAWVLNTLGGRIKAGEQLLPGQLITIDDWPHRIIVEEVPNPGQIVFSANRFYQRPDEASVPVLQLTYDDAEGRFPWDEGYATPEMQPRPGTFVA